LRGEGLSEAGAGWCGAAGRRLQVEVVSPGAQAMRVSQLQERFDPPAITGMDCASCPRLLCGFVAHDEGQERWLLLYCWLKPSSGPLITHRLDDHFWLRCRPELLGQQQQLLKSLPFRNFRGASRALGRKPLREHEDFFPKDVGGYHRAADQCRLGCWMCEEMGLGIEEGPQ